VGSRLEIAAAAGEPGISQNLSLPTSITARDSPPVAPTSARVALFGFARAHESVYACIREAAIAVTQRKIRRSLHGRKIVARSDNGDNVIRS